ncbi:MAG: hypothetical protein F2909_01390 [Actinobacteria bacterium]|nr:hypothetical protein [Actinomycetota bacterium]MSX14988.1 hypothetical protein [Actinomycetota bacterium]MSX35749.1 hypothetical protein [Actinomycetota bacterium]MSX76690.1 hypothetical protein [Actinomycetota bacterium]MSZ71497.1 hypothetical protein [Actinomycetota bacterium]
MNNSRSPFLASARPRWRLAVSLFVALAAVMYWWWPGIEGSGDPIHLPAVLVIGNGDLKEAQTVVSRRLVEEGLTVAWVDAPESWCDVPSELASVDAQPSLGIVISLNSPISFKSCDVSPDVAAQNVVEALQRFEADHSAIATGLSGEADPVVAVLQKLGVRVVDPSSMLADVDEHVDCLWWDDCLPDENGVGYVIVRDANGLTLAGQQRVARMIVAGIQ